jgi:GT2 family glycosyltransferase
MTIPLTVVVITRNRRDELFRTLHHLEALPEHPGIIVIDNGSSDGTAAGVRRAFPGVQLIEVGLNAGAAARNIGVERARTPYVAFCDDDSWWAVGSLPRAVAALDAHPDVALVVGKVLVGADQRLDPCCEEMAASPLPDARGLPGPCVLGFLAAACVIRRDAFTDAGGFEARMQLGGEEELLAIDLADRGWKLVYLNDVVAHHFPSTQRSPAARRRTMVRNALWVAWLRRPLPQALSLTVGYARQALRCRHTASGLAAAVSGLAWVARSRRVVGGHTEASLRLLASARGPAKH